MEKEQAAKMPTEFLADTFAEELQQDTVSFRIMTSLGEAEDSDIEPLQQ